jgi:hypothetical protein
MLSHKGIHRHCNVPIGHSEQAADPFADRWRVASFLAAQLRRAVGRAARRPSALELVP